MIKRIGALVFAFTLLFSFAVPASAAYDENLTYYDSLTASGSQYFDTDVQGSSDLRIVTDFKFDESKTNNLYGASNSQTENLTFALFLVTSTYKNVQVVVRGTTVTFSYDLYKPGERNTLDIDIPNGSVTFNGSTKTFSVANFTSPDDLYLFASNDGGTAVNMGASTIYSLRMYSSGDLIRSYVPSSNSSGAFGLYDEVEGSFGAVVGSGVAVPGDVWTPPDEGPTVAETITDLNSQIHEIEQTIYDDLHTYSAEVDPSTATNFSGNFLSAMSFISDTWTAAYGQLGDMQVIVTFPLFLAIAMLFIGRMNSVIASGAMKSRKNNDKKGGGDVG